MTYLRHDFGQSSVMANQGLDQPVRRERTMRLLDGKVAVITGAGLRLVKASTTVPIGEGARVGAGDISGARKDTAWSVTGAIIPGDGGWAARLV
jgi:hypothetical protein